MSASPPKLKFKPLFILFSSVFFLSILFAFGRLDFFERHLASLFGEGHDLELYAHIYLAASSVLTRSVLPLLCIVLVLKERPRDYGYRLRGSAGLFKVYVALLIIMLPILFIASGTEAFLNRYPLYSGAQTGFSKFFIYEISYFFVFLSGESFWRGYMVFGLKPTFGYYGVAIMAIPYVMIHFGKPFPEAFGALITACVLGYLALKHRSFWLGVALHFTIALSMDLFALWRKAL